MSASKGSLLIVTRHFPPAVSGGARRPFLLAEGLRDRGWRVHVASPAAPAGFPDWIETPHPAGRRGEESAGANPGPSVSAQTKTRLRHILYWPDADMRWAFSARDAVSRAGVKPGWLMTTSPPESAHLAGFLLKAPLGARWLAEMRDSWIAEPLRPELHESALRRALERRLARTLLSRADAVAAVSPFIADEAQSLSGKRASVVGHFARPSATRHTFDRPGPNLLHAGRFTLSHPDRRLDAVLDAFAIAAGQLPDARLHLVGLLTEEERAAAQAHALNSRIILHGEVPHDRALAMQQAADGLILYQPDISALPGKLSEYLLARAPILVVGEGPWTGRLGSIPHFRLRDAARALAAPQRTPRDTLSEALDAYEAIFLGRDAGVTACETAHAH